MMILRFIQSVEVEAAPHDTAHGPVTILGNCTIIVSRAWFQCDRCGIIAFIQELASPMTPPPCPQGCDTEAIT